jgi:hypothetical protein
MNCKLAPIILVVLVIMSSTLSGGEIRFSSSPQEIQLFNSSNNKIMNYIVVKPQEKIRFQAIGVDSLIIYSRISGEEQRDYNYLVKQKNEEKIVNRTSKKSKVTRTLSGDFVSAYNSYKLGIGGNRSMTIINNWGKEIYFKIVANKNERDFNDYEYIRFSPQFYENEIAVEISDKIYTYYQVDNSNIAFDLEGPVLLKIISRLILDDNFQNNKGYQLTVYDNGEQLAHFEEKAQQSAKAFFPEIPDKIPSTGDINIVQIPAGKHHIEIKDGILNRDLIFRFYINKSSIGISE